MKRTGQRGHAGVAALLAVLFMSLVRADVQVAPSPYPTKAEDWPGSGVIRVHGWMTGQRNQFWRERDLKRASIVFAGDSLTGNWRSLEGDFPNADVANRGIGGDVSRGLLFRFSEDVLDLHPRAIVILIGINDLTARQPAADTLWNISLMLQLRDARQSQVPVILCTVPPSANPQAPVDPRQRRLLNEGLRAIAADHDRSTVVDLFHALATADGSPDPRFFESDRLHLSREGYAKWQAVLQPALREAGVATGNIK